MAIHDITVLFCKLVSRKITSTPPLLVRRKPRQHHRRHPSSQPLTKQLSLPTYLSALHTSVASMTVFPKKSQSGSLQTPNERKEPSTPSPSLLNTSICFPFPVSALSITSLRYPLRLTSHSLPTFPVSQSYVTYSASLLLCCVCSCCLFCQGMVDLAHRTERVRLTTQNLISSCTCLCYTVFFVTEIACAGVGDRYPVWLATLKLSTGCHPSSGS